MQREQKTMKNEQKIKLLLTSITIFIATVAIFIVMVVFLPRMTNAGNLEPSGPPGSTMKTLDETPPTWSQKLLANERFKLVLPVEVAVPGAETKKEYQAVLDKETGLVWERSPDTTVRNWNGACEYCYRKQVGGRYGWRLPTVEELASLVDTSVGSAPYIPSGHPFSNVQSSAYWSATTYVGATSCAWNVYFNDGNVYPPSKSGTNYVWCVRGGHY